MKRNVRLILGAGVLCLCLGMAAPRSAKALILDRKEASAIGEEGEKNLKIMLVNGTEKDIEELALSVDEGDFSENLLPEGEVFKAGEERAWYVEPAEAKEEKIPVYDLRLGFGKDKECVLHTLPVGDTEEIVLHLNKDVAYIIFESKDLKKKVSTLEQEKELVKKAEPAAPAASSASTGSYSYDSDPQETYTYTYSEPEQTYSYEQPESYATYETPDSYGPIEGGSTVDPDMNLYDYDTEDDGDDHCLDDGTLLN